MRILVALLLLTTLNASAAKICAARTATVPRDGTFELIGYLDQLLKERIISEKELLRLVVSLKKGILENPIHNDDVLANSPLLIQREGIENYIRGTRIDQKKLLDWCEDHLKEKNRVGERREEERLETLQIRERMVFHRVEGGEFHMSDQVETVKVDTFEAMSTLVTQRHWALVMRENPSEYKIGENTIAMDLSGKIVTMQPDNPVEKVSWNDIQDFIKRLVSLSEEDGPAIHQLIPDSKKGDRYRILTDRQWEYLVTNKGREDRLRQFNKSPEALQDYIWFKTNSKKTTQPVARLRAFVIDGQEFYDLLGNVLNWTQDWSGFSPDANPVRDLMNPALDRVVRGLAFFAMPHGGTTHGDYPGSGHSEYIGFRLVRERAP